MTEQAVRREVSALRFTVRTPPKRLDEFGDFFAALHDMYRVAEVTGQLARLAERNPDALPFRDVDVARMFTLTDRRQASPTIAVLSMRSPLEFILEAAANAGAYSLGVLYLVLKAPEKMARLPGLHAQWHEGRLRAEIVQAQRRAFQRRLEAGDIDVLALGLDDPPELGE